MEEDIALFKCSVANYRLKDKIEANKLSKKNIYKKYRFMLLIIMLLFFSVNMINLIYDSDLSLQRSLNTYFTDMKWILFNVIFLIGILRITEITCFIKTLILKRNSKRKLQKDTVYISFYETYYKINFNLNSQVFMEYIIYYCDIRIIWISDNLIIINSAIHGEMEPIIRKDAFININAFIEFIDERTENKLQV